MNFSKQKLILEYLLSSKDLYARCAGIIKSEFFDVELRQAVKYLEEYYSKYHALPKLDRFKAEFDLDFEEKKIERDDIAWISEECETFAKQSMVKEAIKSGLKDIAENNYDNLVRNILDAVKVTLDRDVGVDLYVNTLDLLMQANKAAEYISTGIGELDEKLGGGLVRKQMTLFSANSGVGKSIMMSNIGDNIAANGLHVVYISLELSQEMVITRLASIATGQDTKTWKENIHKISKKIEEIKEAGAGSYVVKRMPNGATANDIRAYLKQYELTYERKPDIIIVDYLDLMNPIGGKKNLTISEQDKAKSEELYEIGVDYDAHILTASQQNRDGIRQNTPDQAVIAGGFSKINIVDNFISIYMTPTMRLEGVMLLYYLKTRSSSSVGSNSPLKFNRDNLQITDQGDEGKIRATISRLSKNVSFNTKDDMIEDDEIFEGDEIGFKTDSTDLNPESDDLIGLMSFLRN